MGPFHFSRFTALLVVNPSGFMGGCVNAENGTRQNGTRIKRQELIHRRAAEPAGPPFTNHKLIGHSVHRETPGHRPRKLNWRNSNWSSTPDSNGNTWKPMRLPSAVCRLPFAVSPHSICENPRHRSCPLAGWWSLFTFDFSHQFNTFSLFLYPFSLGCCGDVWMGPLLSFGRNDRPFLCRLR